MTKSVLVRVDNDGKTETHTANAMHVDHGTLIIECTSAVCGARAGIVAVYAPGQWITAAVIDQPV